MAVCKTPVASWEAVATRVPRPGFFLGDDRAACPLNNDDVLLDGEALPSSWDLGRLAVLPLELLHQIAADVAEVDPCALVALRNANRATATIVDGLRDFAVVAAFPRALAAVVLLAPGPSGAPVSLSALAACLLARECACCRRARPNGREGDSHSFSLGDCIYLLAPERVCYACFRGCPAYLPAIRSVSASATSSPRPDDDVFTALAAQTGSRPTSICVPPGRYGVLSSAEQSTELYDPSRARSSADTESTTHAPTLAAQPAPIRYAAVIPGPYWEDPGAVGSRQPSGPPPSPPPLNCGYGCLACVHTDRKTGYRGWADPLTRYTKEGLQRHLEDLRFGGRVLAWRDANTGIVSYEHDAPRQNRFPPPAEFGAMADMARKYCCEKTVSGTVARWKRKTER
ncbi:hypothetical protein CMQ_7111 [Grosmannia clavigera kw1407]|uniref:F-box domain containing protein n=1 Tax=Grosmannia clavigera (strain kw1407 / UAMH 11150) TaxID=655863 RepID=F0XP81_GROCL|nr:uncharacterized protein CMQ_7111 [Grosmannia clavigera kw1407]EFX00109.1 hypothetical protein CMQ_7111 [Grosmannia clavigera kw1407]